MSVPSAWSHLRFADLDSCPSVHKVTAIWTTPLSLQQPDALILSITHPTLSYFWITNTKTHSYSFVTSALKEDQLNFHMEELWVA